MNQSIVNAMAKALAYEQQRPAIVMAGIQALNRLIPIALNETGQSRIVGRFLLGLYNGEDFPFVLSDLRGLDMPLFQDCMLVLLMDYCPELEVHERVEDGGTIWQWLMERWAPEVVGE